ncbi:Histidine kinase domain-containing protein [Rubrivivax sp. A210]|uniref:ATP-binding protein n=1 Tax=Rubrivivax sp. A210 TaxID=2772301 RepID=UPI00191ACB82|nr:ATP-binding protein [Rubrivivax sp. A210]CAD5375086.1 Histidine kinase domain-containing protein [Rubrivivax sp. A210]
MVAPLAVAVCQNFAGEVRAAIAAEGWTDVATVAFAARCGRPRMSDEELAALLPPTCSRTLLVGRCCLGPVDAGAQARGQRRLVPDQCFDLVAPPALVAEAMADGAYLVTPGWLAQWPRHLAELGFDGAAAAGLFQEVAQRLLLLDTGAASETAAPWAALQQALGLPASRLAVGLDRTRDWLAREVADWRLEAAQREAAARRQEQARERADHATTLDLLRRLALAPSEEATVAGIEELFRLLFAPAAWHWVPVQDGAMQPQPGLAPELADLLRNMQGSHAPCPSGRGLALRLARGERTLAYAIADEVAFPQFMGRYAALAVTLAGLCALAIESGRNRRQLVEAEKMASMGILVAGVAHEINTPVGVGLAAATTLLDHSREITDQFAARRMTHTALAQFLELAGAEAQLIARNLERIGKLIDTFRQVAVQGRSPERRRFALADCIHETIASLGDVQGESGCEISVACAPGLELLSYPGDWVSVLQNLLTNSIRHGFRQRGHGRVDIGVTQADGHLLLDYRDDGAGLAPEAAARVFDPFYTTDLQRGMGLGMYLVHNLVVHRFKGSIRHDAQHRPGVRFLIEVPL